MLPPDPDSFLPDALDPSDVIDEVEADDLDSFTDEPEDADQDRDPFESLPNTRRRTAFAAPDDLPGFPPIFQYSQDNLQAYSACTRRFQLRHLVRQTWPEPVGESIDKLEDDLKYGDQFHRLIERHMLGIAVPPPIEPPLAEWWQAYLRHPPRDLPPDPPIRKVEASYSVPFSDRRLVAKFDLLAIVPGERVVIVDWKTSAARPDRQLLAERWQTAVYLYVAAEALGREFGRPPGSTVPPESISLIYWFATAPDQPIVFQHSKATHEHYRERLTQITGSIKARVASGEKIWPLTDDLARCQTCTYRVLCDRSAPITADLPDLSEEPITIDDSFFDDSAVVEL